LCFLPAGIDVCGRVLRVIETELACIGLTLLAWRDVPTNNAALGQAALASRPMIRQALIAPPSQMPIWAVAGPEPFERLLYLARRRIERSLRLRGLSPFYIASMSSRTVVYKGLLSSSEVARFYPDLTAPRYETPVAMFHQRFSTNTFPTWALAQPFHFLAHNGEINTLQGNISWAAARPSAPRDGGWGETWSELEGIIRPEMSDSACLDAMLELMELSEGDLLQAIRVLVPPAWWAKPIGSPLEGYFRYFAARMEPWDGPAALAPSDGVLAAAAPDRNRLRPLR